MQKNFKVKINFAAIFPSNRGCRIHLQFFTTVVSSKKWSSSFKLSCLYKPRKSHRLSRLTRISFHRRNFIQFSVIPNFTSAFQRNKRNVACTDFSRWISRWILTSLGLPLAHKVTSRSLGKFQLLDSFFVFTADRVLNYEYSGFSSHRGYE